MPVIGTLAAYQQISRDLDRSLARIEMQPQIRRETDYYLANIAKVETVEDFVDDYRLFNFAMKAFGLQDMTYARAFMVKVLEEGVTDPDSFANKLTDKRYAEFARAFDFARHGKEATRYNPAQQGTTALYDLAAEVDSIPQAVRKAETAYYLATIPAITSAEGLLANDRVLAYALKAHGLEDRAGDEDFLRKLLAGGAEAAEKLAKDEDEKANLLSFVTAYNFAELGEGATTRTTASQGAVAGFMRHSLEQDAGERDQGVRLALYFERKAGGIASWFEVLGDRALGQVVRVALGLPESFAQADIDRQAKFFESRLSLDDFKDPEKLGRFLQRFTAMWQASNPSTATMSPTAMLFSQQPQVGISGDLLFAIAKMKG